MKVLIVDDNANERKLLKLNLAKHGIETVLEAGDGQEALKTAMTERPDVIMSDGLMPRMDGFQLLRTVKTHVVLKQTIFVFYTAVYTDAREVELATALGAEGFIIKPIGPEEFWAELSAIIEKYRGEKRSLAPHLVKEEEEFLKEYSRIVTIKLEEKVRQLTDEIAKRKQTQEALASSSARFEAIFNSLSDAAIFVDTHRRIVLANPGFTAHFGYEFEEVKGRTTDFLYRDRRDFIEQGRRFERGLKEARDRIVTLEYLRKDGSFFWAETSVIRVLDRAGRLLGFAGISRDITERRQMEEEMRHMAHHDSLTGLPNRRFFKEIAQVEMAQARRNNTKAVFLFFDLDRFKEINDVLGHETGDALLKEVAARLKEQVRETDTIARIGGDEFNIMLTDITHVEASLFIVRKLMNALRRPYVVGGHEFQTSASIGMSVYPDDALELDTLLQYADIALYYAKEQGRDNFQFYNPAINVRSVERLKLESSLHQTLERNELVVYYQPQVSMKSGDIVNVEALVRWRHPQLGLLEPKEFLPAAEETGFITTIDRWVIRTACSQIKSWLAAGFTPVGATVNLSSRHFQDPQLVGQISEILKETGLPAQYLDLEITETIAMSNIERTIARLNELLALGVHVSIDDFGTGYSSLNYLKRLPIQKLKIDQSFVRDIATDPDDRAIISAVTAMAHNMKITVLAEGVETKEQMEFLRSNQCDEIQGFAVGRPLPAEGFEELLRKTA